MGIKTLLKEEIQKEIEGLSKEKLGSDEYKTTVDGVTKLVACVNELEKSEFERSAQMVDRDNEVSFKLKQMDDEQKHRYITNGIAVAGIVLPLIVTIWGTKASFKFEETGTLTTTMGRGFINKLLPKK